MRKVWSSITVFCLIFLFMSSSLVMALDEAFSSDTENKTVSLPEVALSHLVDSYMLERNKLLTSEDSNNLQALSVSGIVSDENSHKAILDECGITILNSDHSITSIDIDGNRIKVILSETLYCTEGNKELISCTQTHTLRIAHDENDNLKIIADSYKESVSGFCSCSYIDPDTPGYASVVNANNASGSCLVYKAQTQIGYMEKDSASNLDSFTENAGNGNYTKYGAWYGKNPAPWCAMFVSWCANQVGIPTTIIPKYAVCTEGMNTFKNRGVFYYSSAYGGSYTPSPGDIFFEGASLSASSHTGIVVGVSGNKIYVVDGNCDNQVSYHDYLLTDSGLIGFAKPNYTTSGHNWSSYGSYYRCSDCGMTATSIPGVSSVD